MNAVCGCGDGLHWVISPELITPLAPCFSGNDNHSCASLHLPHENSAETGNTATLLQRYSGARSDGGNKARGDFRASPLPGSVQKGLKVTRSVQDAQHFDTFCIVREEDEMR